MRKLVDYGFSDQIPNVTAVYNDRLSGERVIGGLQFQFIKVAPKRLGSIQVVKTPEGGRVIYGSKERVLMDAVYDWSRFNSLPKGYDWIRESVKTDSRSASRLTQAVTEYGNQATTRRIGYWLEAQGASKRFLTRLRTRLSDSTALIPWIPGQPNRGRIDRRWGVIVNG